MLNNMTILVLSCLFFTPQRNGLLRGPTSGPGRDLRPMVGQLLCAVVTLVTFSSNLGKFEEKKFKKSKNFKKSQYLKYFFF